jgi:uncharacterized protein
MKALVSAGAKVNIADRVGQTPLMVAKRKKYKEIVGILDAAGAK